MYSDSCDAYRLSFDGGVLEAFGAVAFSTLSAELPIMNILASMTENTVA